MKLRVSSGEKPLWSQLYDILEERILNGFYPVGTNLPTEISLMDEFEVSRITVRQAMDKLLGAGLITRKRGKGTIVLERKDKVETNYVSSLNGIDEKNNNTDRRVISVSYELPSVEAAYFFGTNKNIKCIKLVRGIYVDNELVSIQETYLNPGLPLDPEMDFNTSMYKVMEENNCKITKIKEKISASVITAKEKKLFNITKNEAIITRVRNGFAGDIPAEYTFSRYLATGYELLVELL